MGCENPVKSVGLCFFKTGVQTELFFPSGDSGAATALAAFLESSDAAILTAENFSAAELSYLHSRRHMSGHRLFLGPDCCAGRALVGRGRRCEEKCALRMARNCDD